ncbi:winged helix-turn-helix transcriptional regulator [Nonomuraea purpurea]|uniref:Winged helix-turn-helix transcriptional regulator n=1 Tax=Nonomuraea purpurea TaxID=1849276 RepID=A0ABV8GGJ1_9ACTN
MRQPSMLDGMRRTSFAEMSCAIARSLEIVGDWWTPLIIRDVYLGVRRFDDLVTDLGISRNLLTARLDQLVAQRILERRRYQERPARHEYELTQAGRDLVPVLMALMAWGNQWAGLTEGPPALLEHRPCGNLFTPLVTCPHCGGQVTADNVKVHPGPGGRQGPGTWVLAERLTQPDRP